MILLKKFTPLTILQEILKVIHNVPGLMNCCFLFLPGLHSSVPLLIVNIVLTHAHVLQEFEAYLISYLGMLAVDTSL